MADPISPQRVTPPLPISPAGPVRPAEKSEPGGDFAAMLRGQLERVNQMQAEADEGVQRILTGAPAITGSMRLFMEWWATLSRNVVNQTATTTTVRNDADDGDISTSTVSDDGTTFVRGEFST